MFLIQTDPFCWSFFPWLCLDFFFFFVFSTLPLSSLEASRLTLELQHGWALFIESILWFYRGIGLANFVIMFELWNVRPDFIWYQHLYFKLAILSTDGNISSWWFYLVFRVRSFWEVLGVFSLSLGNQRKLVQSLGPWQQKVSLKMRTCVRACFTTC